MTEDMKSSSTSGNSGVNAGTMHSADSHQSPPSSTPSSHLPDSAAPPPPPLPRATRLNAKDISNSEFVNRLLTATRITDFYSANVAPHSFFYSEMLRSLVQNRGTDAVGVERETHHSALPFVPNHHQHRRNRKRMWPNRFAELRATNGGAGESTIENALLVQESELKLEKIRKRESKSDFMLEKEAKIKSPLAGVGTEKSPSNMIFPSNNSSPWYSPYPPFFIDLRVSGHIYDDGKPKLPTPAPGNLDPKAIRQGSAFTVPQSRSAMAPMNLTTNQSEMPAFKERIAGKERYSPVASDGFEHHQRKVQHDEELAEEERKERFSKGRFDEEVIAVDDS